MTADKNNSGLTRRKFIKYASLTAFAAPQILPSRVLGRDGAVAPSEKIVLAGIGVGRRGMGVLRAMLGQKDVHFVATCDVYRPRREQVKQMVDSHYGNQDCMTYIDMQEMLARPDIDAVLIATGERWHAMASLMAAKAGKDVFCEKPCAMTIGETQALADGIKRYGRVFQAGTQRRSMDNYRFAVELAQSGKLGRLHTLHASLTRLNKNPNVSWLEAQPEPPRDELDWNGWLGPCPWRPYNKGYIPSGWFGHRDFEAGGYNLLNWGSHTFDLCQWANSSDHTAPVEYELTDKAIVATYSNGVKLIGDFLPTAFGNRDPQYRTSTGTCPVRFEGDEGWVETGDSGEIVLSPNLERFRKQTFSKGLSAADHGRNFFDCVKSRARPVCNEDIMRKSHIACLAASISVDLDRKVRLDPAKEEFINDDDANRLRSRAMREPWTLNI